jgi:hypothetical protein
VASSRVLGAPVATVAIPFVFEVEVFLRIEQILALLRLPPGLSSPNFQAETLADLDTIIAFLQASQSKNKPVRIALGAPLVLRKGKLTVANIPLPNDEVLIVPILTDDTAGVPVPPPAGDIFSVVSSSPSLTAVIDTTTLVPAGTPGVKINAMVQVSPGLSFTVSDSAGLTTIVQGVDIVADTTPKAITLDIAHAVVQTQPVPAAPGP